MNGYFQLRKSTHYVVDHALRFPQFETLDPLDQRHQKRGNLHLRKMHTDAYVHAMTKPYVVSIAPLDIELVRFILFALVAIRRAP